jgi:hypothetical protein
MTIIDALEDPEVFATHFRGNTWRAWRVFLCALFSLQMTQEEIEIYRKHTGRASPPTSPLNEAWLVCGRRAGKSFILALIAVFLGCFKDWRPFLGPGEVGTIMIVARDRRQARVVKRFIHGLLNSVPMLRRAVEAEGNEGITLKKRRHRDSHCELSRSPRIHNHRVPGG